MVGNMYLYNSKKFLSEHNGTDFYFVLSEILNHNLMKYTDILFACSIGESLSDMRGNHIILDSDWDEPEDFGFIQCYVCEKVGDKMTINEFLSAINYISQKYITEYPNEFDIVQKYVDKIESRYKSFFSSR